MDTVFETPASREAELKAKPGVVRFLRAAPVRAVMIDGDGKAGSYAFATRMPGLYATAYDLHFALRRRGLRRRAGMLEGLYWMADGTIDLDAILGPDRGTWRWTLLITLPDEATDDEIAASLAVGQARLPAQLAADLRVAALDEGEVAQVLHVGPYEAERPTIERLHAAIAEAGLRPRGRHHELYLGDPRRASPSMLRTLLRHPVERA
jgi:hypothetical protein